MKAIRWFNIILALLLLSACSRSSDGPGFALGKPTATLRPPIPDIRPAPDESLAVSSYLEAWQNDDYETMYGMLTKVGQDTISLEDFAAKHNNALNTMGAASFDFEILSGLLNPYLAEVAYRINYHTALIGDLQRDMVMRLSLENEQWRIQWDEGLILPELGGGNTLAMDYAIPARGNIYDREGAAVAVQADAVALGIDMSNLPEDGGGVLGEVAQKCDLPLENILEMLETGTDWYIPMCEVAGEDAQYLLRRNLSGLVITPYQARFYDRSGIAPQAVGYTQFISEEILTEYRRQGYRGDEKIGTAGIEKWGEDYLAGQHGGSLYVVGPDGQIVTRIAESSPQAASSLYLTINSDMQVAAQKALSGFRGAVVVLERDSGRVLVMASSPGFDPNLFEPNNNNSGYLLGEVVNDPRNPLLNRAAQGEYPLGSVFKVITMTAALESGLYLAETPYDCQYEFTELPDRVRYDWTYEHCQERLQDGDPETNCNTSDSTPSGLLTLQEGLMRSCNPYFWHIGLDLFNNERQQDIANMAMAFGLGQATGIGQVAEAPGYIPFPGTAEEALNNAIGQGETLVTPLQVASFTAAIGNGGTLYRPQIVEQIQPVDGSPTVTFKPEARGTLPIRPENLQILQDAMTSVIENPRGTASYRLRGLVVDAAGKTGTAESGSGKPHGWFAGYTMASEDTGLPDIAIAVIVENVGDGSEYAAPIFKRMVETYYYGSPQSLFWWETTFGVPSTPTPLGGIPTKTPKRR
ncbi:MAG: hypothetical protein JXA13_03050 [Anaerolineales bacterium]|nr:hypothetical protein [Anaerolineales bacterium]